MATKRIALRASVAIVAIAIGAAVGSWFLVALGLVGLIIAAASVVPRGTTRGSRYGKGLLGVAAISAACLAIVVYELAFTNVSLLARTIVAAVMLLPATFFGYITYAVARLTRTGRRPVGSDRFDSIVRLLLGEAKKGDSAGTDASNR